MPDRYLMLIGLLVMLPSAAAHAVGVELKTNPFERPLIKESVADPQSTAEAPSTAMALRGTMAAGRYSLADISGEILAIGQQVNGYTLVAVHEHHVVLQKDAIKTTLSIDKDVEEKQ